MSDYDTRGWLYHWTTLQAATATHGNGYRTVMVMEQIPGVTHETGCTTAGSRSCAQSLSLLT